VPAATMRTNGNFSDTRLERLHSISINRLMSLSDADDLESPLVTPRRNSSPVLRNVRNTGISNG